MRISRVRSPAVMVIMCVTMVAAGWSASALAADPGPSAPGQGGRLMYVIHADSEDIAAFRVGGDGRPQRIGDLVPTGGHERKSRPPEPVVCVAMPRTVAP